MASHKLKIGATLVKEEIGYWEPKLGSDNAIMRVFPNSDGLIPSTSDARYAYAARVGMREIFVSTKIAAKYVGDGHGTWDAGMADTKAKLKALVDTGDFDMVWYTEHHEPEGDMTPTRYKTYYTKPNGIFAMVNGIGKAYRPKVKCGHVLTRQWTENSAGRSYREYDTGLGDYFGVDMYSDSFDGSSVASSPESTAAFCASFKAYKYNSRDVRPRIWPELGRIGLPYDTDGYQRALWIQGVHKEASTWDADSTGWTMVGWIWWNGPGKAGGALSGRPGIGSVRHFHLDRRHDGSGPGNNGYTILRPPLPLDRWKQIASYNNH